MGLETPVRQYGLSERRADRHEGGFGALQSVGNLVRHHGPAALHMREMHGGHGETGPRSDLSHRPEEIRRIRL